MPENCYVANSVDPESDATERSMWSVSTLFAQSCLAEYLG